jgi:hypothetical protein
MWVETLQVDGRNKPIIDADPGGFSAVHIGNQATLTKAELENCIVFPHDDRVLCVDGFEGEACPYPEGPVFVWLTIDQHRRAKEMLA